MAQCPAITARGTPCQGTVHPSKTWCPAHDPARDEARKRAASIAGRSRQGGEIAGIKDHIKRLAKSVEEGKLDPGRGSVAGQLWNYYLKAYEVQLKERDTRVKEVVLERIRLPEFETLQQEVQELRGLVASKSENGRTRSWVGHGTA